MDATNLIAYLPFDTSTTEDLCGNTWTASGSPTIKDGAIHLPSGAYLTTENIIDLSVESKWTFMCKCKRVTSSGDEGFFGIGDGGSGSGKRGIIVSSDGIYVDVASGSGWQAKTSTIFPSQSNVWCHLAIVKNGGSLLFFEDGQLVWTATITAKPLSNGRLTLGGNSYGYTNDIYLDEVLFYDGVALHTENFTPPTDNDYFDIKRKVINADKTWRYENEGTADKLIISGTTLTDLPETKSITGTAFYQTQRAKCFDLPSTNEVWMKFDVYFDGTNRWRAYNGGSNGTTGITAQTTGSDKIISVFSNNTNVQQTTGFSIPNQLQTVLLHMMAGSSAGVIEAWVDGRKIYTYTGDVNHGEDFADIYLQSDGSGTFFSNVIVSNAEIGLYENVKLTGEKELELSFDIERKVVNDAFKALARQHLSAYLPFDSSPTEDLCGNTWTATGSPTIAGGKLSLNGSSYLQTSAIELGGRDFTISGYCYTDANCSTGARVFNIHVAPDTGNVLVQLRHPYSNVGWRLVTNTAASVNGSNMNTQDSGVIPFGQHHHFEVVYRYSAKTMTFFIDGIKKVQYTNCPQFTRQKFVVDIGTQKFSSDKDYPFTGTIDEFQIYDGIALHTENFTPPTAEDYEAEEYPFRFEADCERVIFNENLQIVSYLKAYLPFDDSPTKDLCGNIWHQNGSAEINDTGAIHCNALQINNKSLPMGAPSLFLEGGITLGGRDFTIKFCANVFEFPKNAGDTSYLGAFFVLSPTAGNLLKVLTSDTGTLYLGVNSGGVLTVGCLGNFNSNVATLELGRTYSLEYVYSHDDGKVFVFLDGRGISTVDITISETYFSEVYIDYSHWSANHIGAAIDEFRIYDGVALHTENFEAPTKENYAEKTLELERNLFFAFDTTTESTITNNRKPLDRYISFPGVVGSYGLVPLETLAGKNIFTIEVKFSTAATASSDYNYDWKTIIGRDISGGTWEDDFGLCVNGGKLCFWAEPKRGNSFASGTGGVLTDVSANDGQVHSVAVVSKGISIDLYCDGELVGHGDVVNAQIPTDYKICLATNYNSRSSYLSMKFYEARLWSVARTQEDIFAQIDGNEEGLEAWYIPAYRTDIIPDLTGNERHITLYGDATADFIYELATEHEADIECSIFNESLSFGVGQEVAEGITVLEGLDASQSKTGTAFYQTTQKKCFHLPPMPEVWMEFDVYFDGSNRWRAFNGGANGVTGITAQTSGNLDFFSNGSAVKNVAGVCRANELQTVRLHMITGSTNGVIEAWVDGQIIYRYTGDVNHGDYFEDLYLQSDGAGTFFSNLYISNNGLPARRYLKRDFNMERRVSNKSMGWWVSFSELEQTAFLQAPWLKIPPEKKPPDEQEWVTQAAIERCFDLSPTYDIWIDFDVYSGGVTVWRAGNVSPDYGICGIMSSIGGALNYLSNGETIQSFPGACEPNEIQPVLLHMLSGVSDGIIETWVNGELIWQYVGDVNNGEDFCDLFLQADDDGAFFSNIVLSTERLTPRRRSLYPPIYLCVSYNGVPISYPFEYSEAPITPALAVYWGGKEWYNKLVSPTSSKAGAVRVWHNSEEYALSVD